MKMRDVHVKHLSIIQTMLCQLRSVLPRVNSMWESLFVEYALPAAERVAKGEFDVGILICGTGIGMSISANKVKGVRCALTHDVYSAKLTRQHNDANMIAMGERVIGPGPAREIAKAFLETQFEGGRHANRVEKITAYEDKHN